MATVSRESSLRCVLLACCVAGYVSCLLLASFALCANLLMVGYLVRAWRSVYSTNYMNVCTFFFFATCFLCPCNWSSPVRTSPAAAFATAAAKRGSVCGMNTMNASTHTSYFLVPRIWSARIHPAAAEHLTVLRTGYKQMSMFAWSMKPDVLLPVIVGMGGSMVPRTTAIMM